MNWEDRLRSWTGPASDTEDEKRKRTEDRIRKALQAYPGLSQQPLSVYAKGSYANNTNVRLDSDVDINVEYTGGMYLSFQDPALNKQAVGISDYTGPFVTFDSFKTEVHRALTFAFGSSSVDRRNKCILVNGGSTTLDSDVVPCWTHRHYFSQARYVEGTAFFPDSNSNERIENYPQQHYDNGVAKNNRTGRRYKRIVRAFKRLENEMVDKTAIEEVPSYLIECLVYACPDQLFNSNGYLDVARSVLVAIYEATKGPEPKDEQHRWTEVNEIKFLFHPSQKWTRQQANQFAVAAWNYMGLG